MFIRLIRAEIAEQEELRRLWERSAPGWVESTGGVTAAGQWLVAVRYPSEDAARRNEDRPNYQTWWSEIEAHLRGPARLDGSDDVHAVSGTGPGDAGFVQFMRATVRDRRQFERVEESVGDRFSALRPDFLGGLRIWHGADRLTVVDSFTSEADARAGEAKEMPEDLKATFGQWMALLDDVEWYDIVDPWARPSV